MLTKLRSDLKVAMKEKQVKRKEVIQCLIGAFTLAEKEKRAELSETEVTEIVQSKIKQTKDAIKDFTKGGRPELVAEALEEISILEGYLPEMLTEDQLKVIIKDTISELNLDKPNMGLVMKAVKEKVKGKADMSLVNKLVKESLS